MRNVFLVTLMALWLAHTAGYAAEGETQENKQVEESVYWQLGFSTGYHFTRGDYGTGLNSDVHYVPLTVELDLEAFTFEVTVPYIGISGTGNVTAGDGIIVIDDDDDFANFASGYLANTDHGLGDVVAGVTYTQVPPKDYLPFVSATFKTKFPTASEQKGLGTGEYDYTIQGDISQKIWIITPFGTLGYRFLGDTPTTDFQNTFFASGGAALDLKIVSLGAAIDYRQASSNTVDDSVEISPFVTLKAGRHLALNGYTTFGLTDGAPDFGAGLGITVRGP